MTPEQLVQFCQLHIDKYAVLQGAWVQMQCPFAKMYHKNGTDIHPSFGINTQWPHGYNCYSCPIKGKTLDTLCKSLHITYDSNADALYSWRNVPYTESAKCVKAEPVLYDEILTQLSPCPQHPYLAQRGISAKVAIQLDLRYDANKQRVCFPIYNAHGLCVGIQGRAIAETVQPKYLFYKCNNVVNTNLVYNEHLLNFDKPLIVVEGVFDVAKIFSTWYNVTTFFGANITQCVLHKLQYAAYVLAWLDNDKAGNDATIKLQKSLQHGKIIDIRPLGNGYNDPGQMPVEMVQQHVVQCLQRSNVWI